jgi:hypothetical protein
MVHVLYYVIVQRFTFLATTDIFPPHTTIIIQNPFAGHFFPQSLAVVVCASSLTKFETYPQPNKKARVTP